MQAWEACRDAADASKSLTNLDTFLDRDKPIFHDLVEDKTVSVLTRCTIGTHAVQRWTLGGSEEAACWCNQPANLPPSRA